jgi:hypothetical protein
MWRFQHGEIEKEHESALTWPVLMASKAYTVGLRKKAPVGKSETLLFLITRGILNEFFADFFALNSYYIFLLHLEKLNILFYS